MQLQIQQNPIMFASCKKLNNILVEMAQQDFLHIRVKNRNSPSWDVQTELSVRRDFVKA